MKYLNYGYDHLMGIALIIGMGKALVMAFNGLTSGILSVNGNPAVLRDFFLFLIAAVVVIYTLSLKTVRSAAIALCVAFVCDLLAGLYSDVLLFVVLAILSLALAKCWEKLSEEEGFPLFDIPFSELEERKEIAGIKKAARDSAKKVSLNNRKLNFAELGSLSFEKPDFEKFPCLSLAFDAIGKDGNIPCAMNAANEAAVAAFLHDRISYFQIGEVVGSIMDCTSFIEKPTVEDILATNDESYVKAGELIAKLAR